MRHLVSPELFRWPARHLSVLATTVHIWPRASPAPLDGGFRRIAVPSDSALPTVTASRSRRQPRAQVAPRHTRACFSSKGFTPAQSPTSTADKDRKPFRGHLPHLSPAAVRYPAPLPVLAINTYSISPKGPASTGAKMTDSGDSVHEWHHCLPFPRTSRGPLS